jgi:hypothetical protein
MCFSIEVIAMKDKIKNIISKLDKNSLSNVFSFLDKDDDLAVRVVSKQFFNASPQLLKSEAEYLLKNKEKILNEVKRIKLAFMNYDEKTRNILKETKENIAIELSTLFDQLEQITQCNPLDCFDKVNSEKMESLFKQYNDSYLTRFPNSMMGMMKNAFEKNNGFGVAISNNKITKIPSTLISNTVNHFEANNNKLKKLPLDGIDSEVAQKMCIRNFSVSNNELESLPNEFEIATSYALYVNLSNNKLKSLPVNFKGFPALNIANNKFVNGSLVNLEHGTFLQINGNRLTEIPKNIKQHVQHIQDDKGNNIDEKEVLDSQKIAKINPLEDFYDLNIKYK